MRQVEIGVIHVIDDRHAGIEFRPVQRMARALHDQNIRRGPDQKSPTLRQRQLRRQDQTAPPERRQGLGHGVNAQESGPLAPLAGQEDRQRPFPPWTRQADLQRQFARQADRGPGQGFHDIGDTGNNGGNNGRHHDLSLPRSWLPMCKDDRADPRARSRDRRRHFGRIHHRFSALPAPRSANLAITNAAGAKFSAKTCRIPQAFRGFPRVVLHTRKANPAKCQISNTTQYIVISTT